MNTVLLLTVVLAWGLSWYAIAVQVGTIPVEASIAYRFLLAGSLLMAWTAWRRSTIVIPLGTHPLLALMGICLFSLNFVFLYSSTAFIASGVTSVVFATASLMGVFNALLFDGVRPNGKVVTGAVLGVCGLVLLFLSDAGATVPGTVGDLPSTGPVGVAGTGLVLALFGTYMFSVGNVVSIRIRRHADFVTATSWAMLYGGALAAAVSMVRHGALPPPPATASYLVSLSYLVVGASLVGFLAYLDLVRRAGAARAAYATVLFPLIALTISALLEGYTWTWRSGVGISAVLIGALIMFVDFNARGEANGKTP